MNIQVLVICLGSLGVLQSSAGAQNNIGQGMGCLDTLVGPVHGGKASVDVGPAPTISDKVLSLEPTAGQVVRDSWLCCEKLTPDEMLPLLSEGDQNDSVAVKVKDDAEEEEKEDPVPIQPTDVVAPEGEIDDELGILRVRSQPVGIDSELGILRIRPTEDVPLEVEPEPTRQTSVFLTGRANVYGGNNLFRTPNPIDDRIYQTGIGIFAFPRLTNKTNLVLSAEANLARYEDLSVVDYDEIQFQAGIRQRLGKRSYGQLNWRYQDLSTPGSDSFFTANYVELLLSRRDILSNRTWLDAYYQARLSYSDPEEFSRFTQIATGSLNYGFDPQTRVSLLYQLFLDDYTQVSRHDTYHQALAQFSHDLSSTTRLSVFTGFRFGRSSRSNVNFDDTIYGASININLPLF